MKVSFDFWTNIIAPPLLAVVYVVLCWLYMRVLRRGRPLTAPMRAMLKYGFLWAVGGMYLVFIGAHSGWSLGACVAVAGAWGATLACLAWWRHRRKSAGRQDPPSNESPPEPVQGCKE